LTSDTHESIFGHSVGLLEWDGGSAHHKATTYPGQCNAEMLTHIHASSWIRTYDPSVWAVGSHICLTPHDHRHWL